MPKARLEIWNPTNTVKLADLWDVDPKLWQRNFDDIETTGYKLNEPGSGGLVIQQDHPAAAHVVRDNIVKLHADTTPVCAYRIKGRRTKTVSKRHAARTIVARGDGLWADWEKARVGPWSYNRPNSPDRIFNWASPPYDTTGWSSTLYTQTRVKSPHMPKLWPNSFVYSEYVLTRADSASQPVGDYLFRRPFTLASAADVVFYIAADSTYDVWIDGVTLERNAAVKPDDTAWQETWRAVVPHDAGTHHLGVRVENWGGRSGLIVSAFTVANGHLDMPLFSTGGGTGLAWRSLDVSATRPGFTAPQILQILLSEAQGRGALLGWTIQSHGVHPVIETYGTRVGDSVKKVVDDLATGWIDVEADLVGLKLHLYPKDGLGTATGKTATIADLEVIEDGDVTNAALGIYADGIRWRTDNSSIGDLGRNEGSLTLGTVTDAASADKILDTHLAANSRPVESVVGEVIDVANAVAGIDFKVGDSVSVNGNVQRVVGMSWDVHRNGDLIPYPEFEAPAAVRRREFERSVERQISSFDSPATASLLTMDPLVVKGRPSYETWNWTWSDDIEDALNEIDPEKPWQVKSPKTVMRLAWFQIQCDPDDLPDAWGTTKVTIMKNGVELNPLYRRGLNTLVDLQWTAIWGYEIIYPGDRIQVACLESGGHVDGTIELIVAEAV